MNQNIKLYDQATDFSLTATNGEEVTLSSFAGKQNVFLIFNRGFSCPFCRRHMTNVQKDYALFQARRTEVITVGPNTAKEFQRFWEAQQMPFIGLSDVGNRVAKLYFQEFNILKFGWVPALFVIDMQQRIRFVHYGKGMSDIPDNQVILSVLDEISSS